MALHNFIRWNSQSDAITQNIPDNAEYIALWMPDHDEYTRVADVIEEGDSDPAMVAVRGNITYQLRRQLNTNIWNINVGLIYNVCNWDSNLFYHIILKNVWF